MSIIKEYREFFIRTINVNSGSKKDMELGFPTTTTKVDCCGNIKTVGNRLLREHIATDDVIKKFLETIGFKLNIEDTSTLTEQGFVLKASDNDSASFLYVPPTSFTKAVLPHQLPEIEASTGITVTVVYYDVTLDDGTTYSTLSAANASNNNYRPIYQISLSGTSTGGNVELLHNDYTSAANLASAGDQLLASYSLDTSTYLSSVGDKLEIRSQLKTEDIAGGSTRLIKCKIDGNEIFSESFNVDIEIVELEIHITKTATGVYKYKSFYRLLNTISNLEYGGEITVLSSALSNPSVIGIYGNSLSSEAGEVVVHNLEIKHFKI